MLAVGFSLVVGLLLILTLWLYFTIVERDALRGMFREASERCDRLFDVLKNAQAKRQRFQQETFKLRAKLKNEVESNFALVLELTKQENEHEADIRDAHQRLRLLTIELAHTQIQGKLAEGRIKRLTDERNRLGAEIHKALEEWSKPEAVPPESEITFRHGQAKAARKKGPKAVKGTKRKPKSKRGA